MADSKITALTALTAADPVNDMFPVVDVSDTSMAASGTTKRISVNNILSSSPTASGALTVTGLVTAGSATITGAATVGTTLGVTGNITGSGADPNFNNGSLNLFLSGNSTGDPALSFSRYNAASLNNRGAKIQYVFRAVAGQESGSLAFYTNPDAIGSGSLVERARFGSEGNLLVGITSTNLNGGCLQLKSGVTFPATQVASSDANTLDDYEEGTFVPIISGSTAAGVGTYSEQVGRYTKVGRIVTVDTNLTWSAHTGTGNIRIDGLPFSSNSVSVASGSIGILNNIAMTANYIATAYNFPSSTSILPLQYATGGSASISIPMDAAGGITVSMTYTV